MKKGKYIICALIILVLSVIGVRCAWFYIASHDKGDDGQAVYDKSIDYLNNETKSAILLYGDNINFKESFKYSKIEKLDEQNFKVDSNYIFLIINDLDGNTDLNESQIKMLKNYADSNSNFNFFYIGITKLDLFKSAGFRDVSSMEGDMSYGYVMMEGTRMSYSGIWSDDDNKYIEQNKDLFGENILDTIMRIVQSNE